MGVPGCGSSYFLQYILRLMVQQTEIAEDPNTHRSMLVPIVLGSDKTTVSIATGQTEFHPVFFSILNLHNSVRRAHNDALLPVAFLPIPKST